MEGLQVPESTRAEKRSNTGSGSSSVKIHSYRRRSLGNWTKEEDQKLATEVSKMQKKSWRQIAASLSTERTNTQCYKRWTHVLNPELTKGRWTEEEDAKLKKLVEKHGAKNWPHIAKFFEGRRVGKQCRERWQNNFNPSIRRGSWTQEEDNTIARYHAEWGNKWSKIAKFLPGRNGDIVKLHWRSKMKSKGGQALASVNPEASKGSNKRLFIKNIAERSEIEEALFDLSSDRGPSDFSIKDFANYVFPEFDNFETSDQEI